MNGTNRRNSRGKNGQDLHELRKIVTEETFLKQKLLDSIGDSIFVHDFDGNFIYVNEPAYKTRGYTKDELLEMNLRQLDAAKFSRLIDERMKDLKEQGEILSETAHKRKDGSVMPIEIHSRLLKIGGKLFSLTVARDITLRKKAEKALQMLETRYRTLVENANEAIIVLQDERIQYVNPKALQISGYKEKEVLFAPFLQFVHPDNRDSVVERYKTMITNRERAPRVFSIKFMTRNGDTRWLHVNAASIEWENKPAVLLITTDITEHREREARLSFMATHDPLTRLANRALLNDHLSLAVASAQRTKKGFPLMFLDLDNFKKVNDTLGHTMGDELLTNIAQRLQAILRGTDTLSRVGGDEFLLLLPDVSTKQGAAKAAERVLSIFQRPFSLHGQSIHITTSIGISMYPEDGENADALIRNADDAMYKAKNRGKNSYLFSSPKT